eukprot:9485319-Pyramimonas_sp.AAC.1
MPCRPCGRGSPPRVQVEAPEARPPHLRRPAPPVPGQVDVRGVLAGGLRCRGVRLRDHAAQGDAPGGHGPPHEQLAHGARLPGGGRRHAGGLRALEGRGVHNLRSHQVVVRASGSGRFQDIAHQVRAGQQRPRGRQEGG